MSQSARFQVDRIEMNVELGTNKVNEGFNEVRFQSRDWVQLRQESSVCVKTFINGYNLTSTGMMRTKRVVAFTRCEECIAESLWRLLRPGNAKRTSSREALQIYDQFVAKAESSILCNTSRARYMCSSVILEIEVRYHFTERSPA